MIETSNFRSNLKVLCQGYGTVSKLAEHLGITRVSASQLVNGHTSISIEQGETIANYFGFSLKQMLLPPEKFSIIATETALDNR